MIPDTADLRLSQRHFAALDGLRGLAILMVMLHHFEWLLPARSALGNLVKGIMYTGWSGVDLFFVLSGFLITGILIDTRDSVNYFSSFYVRRMLRIFPLYYSVLGSIVIFASIAQQPWLERFMPLASDRPFYFVYLNNWWILMKDTWHPNIMGHFWSLAVEEQFYLLWPLCVWLIPPNRLLRSALAGCGAALVLRLVLVPIHGPSHAVDQNTFTRMDTLLAGACCAIVARDALLTVWARPWLLRTSLLAAGGIFCIDVFAGELRANGYFMETVGFSLLAAGYAAFLLYVFEGRGSKSWVQRILGSRMLANFGKYSYGMYVLHVPFLIVGTVFLTGVLGLGANPVNSAGFVAALILATYLGAKLSYHALELRFLRLKDRFSPQFIASRPVYERAQEVIL